MKKIMIGILLVVMAAGYAFAQDNEESDASAIGLTFGVDYHSEYFWRGTRYFSGDGAVLPYITWDIFNTGLTLGVAKELSMSWFWNGFQKRPEEYYLDPDGDGTTWTKKKLKNNQDAYVWHSLDFGIDYSYTIKDAVTLGASVWYWWYYNTKQSSQLANPQNEAYGLASGQDWSFLTATVSIGLPIVPFLNPEISATYDYYVPLKRGGDWYVSMSIGHDFELTDYVSLGLGLSAGYYYFVSAEDSFLYLDSDQNIQVSRTIAKKGFSDLTPSLSMTYSKDGWELSAGFNWLIVPARSWYKGDAVHRYYATLGASYSL